MKLENLNKEQREAVIHGEGPLLIVAGAGTGKTTVIAQRIAYLIEQKKAKPEEILAVTFTDKAAGEMEERVDRELDFGYMDLWISTFHAFCERILRDYALDIGLPSDFKLLDSTSSWLLIRQNLDKLELDYYRPKGNPTKFVHALISHFSRCKDQGIYPEDYLQYADTLKTNLTELPEDIESERIKEIASAYHVYQKLLLENSAFDFGDLINYCLQLFQKRPIILKKYREKFKYILVDEFQDTNWAQYELVKLLAAPNNNLTVCADDDQAIYRFRGASYNNILQFKKDFKKAKEVFLINNYRSCQNILDLSYNFILGNNPNRLECVSKINKKLIAPSKTKGEIQHLHFKTLDEEVKGVIEKILKLLKGEEAGYNDFVILVRANDAARPFIRALERAGIPHQFLASRGLYSKPVILDILAYFNALNNSFDDTAMYRILNLPFLEISHKDVSEVLQHCRFKAKSIIETLEGMPQKTAIMSLLELIKKHTKLAREKNISEVFIAFIKDSGYLKFLATDDKRGDLDFLNQFYKKIKTFEETVIDPSLKNFVDQMNLEIDSGEQGRLEFDPEQGPDLVRIMTIHTAKGLEFKYVFLVNMVDKRFPSIEKRELIEIPDILTKEVIPQGDAHLEEERRLCYVAITRAKEKLFFTSADDYGGQRKKKLSRFMGEIGIIADENKKTFNDFSNKKEKGQVRKKREVLKIPEYFSFTQLTAFSHCPLQYKFAHILKVPTRGKASLSFGKTMHNTLYEFFKSNDAVNSNQTLFKGTAQKEKTLKFDELIEVYNKNWIDEWYENKAQKNDYYKSGKDSLKVFYDDFVKNKPEILKVNNELALELSFKIKVGGHTLIGKVDRIDSAKEGIEIIDYKTGNAKEKLSQEDKEQLFLYQIAAEDAFNVKPKKLTYYYLEGEKKISFEASEKDKEKERDNILTKIEGIKSSDFSATPGWQCRYCDFKDICDFSQKNGF